ncbi:MAG TPA: DUF6057 family protein [Sedimentisphaerales bacterium]|jgi:hypothetical protein|nr:DUF6057 family protein [Sedimentisphaerales bacterium]HNU31311.1 DUF6057 family protein [Sedimentisphaerales bacterium]
MARESILDHRRLESGLSAAVFLGLFVYLWKGIEPHLLYYGFGVFAAHPIVSLDGSFLRDTLSTPGGPAGALAALLAQSYAWSWLGALTIAALLGVLFLGIRRLLRLGRAERFRDLAWVPALLAMTVYSFYYENPLPALLAVTLSVWAAILYAGLPTKTLPSRAVWFGVLFATLYCLAGASALVFAGIACVTEAVLHRRIKLALVQAVLAAGGALVLGRFVFGLALSAICTAGTPWEPDKALKLSPLANWLVFVLYAFVPSLILVAFLGQVLTEAEARKSAPHSRRRETPRSAGKPAQAFWRRSGPCLGVALRMLAVAGAAALCLAFSRTHVRYERTLHYHAQQRDWDAVLALAARMRGRHPLTPAGVFDINRALAHQGRLGSELCAFPQDDVKMLFITSERLPGRVIHAKSLELYLDLGYLNMAEKNAYELLAQEGPSPRILEAMVRVHLAKGQYEAARVVLQALRKSVGGRRYVRRWEPVVADPARAQTDPLIQSWRRVRNTRDDTSIAISPAALANLLLDHPGHRLAFEYLMACHLLRDERAELIGRLPMLRPLGYTQLPRHYAEALLVQSLRTGTPVDPQGWTLDPDLQRQFQDIRTIVTQSRGDDRMVYDTLVPKYGDTYMFYSMFHLCGLK